MRPTATVWPGTSAAAARAIMRSPGARPAKQKLRSRSSVKTQVLEYQELQLIEMNAKIERMHHQIELERAECKRMAERVQEAAVRTERPPASRGRGDTGSAASTFGLYKFGCTLSKFAVPVYLGVFQIFFSIFCESTASLVSKFS